MTTATATQAITTQTATTFAVFDGPYLEGVFNTQADAEKAQAKLVGLTTQLVPSAQPGVDFEAWAIERARQNAEYELDDARVWGDLRDPDVEFYQELAFFVELERIEALKELGLTYDFDAAA